MTRFNDSCPFEKRKEMATKILNTYSDRIPVIIESAPRQNLEINRHKYIIPTCMVMSRFIYEVSKHIQIQHEQSLFFLTHNTLVPVSATMGYIYEKYRDTDLFLYFSVCTENAFGDNFLKGGKISETLFGN